ncbi:MAG: tripartite tricarboxylate transporter substrate binding protein [Pseudomonadota bacterium]
METCCVSKRLFVGLVLLFLWQFPSSAQASSDYPNKPIQVIVGWTAGASEDLRFRSLAPKMEEVLGQPIVVINKPGAAAAISMTLIAKAKPDGYTIGNSSSSSLLFKPHMEKMEYNTLTDFTFIAGTCTQPYAIVVRNDAPWKTFQSFIDYAKKNPGKIKYGTYGVGGGVHIFIDAIGKNLGLKWGHVPFKGDQPNITALLGGHVPVSGTSSAFIPHAKAGKLRPLAIFSDERLRAFPDVPTLKECGFNFDYRWTEILGFSGPKGLPPEIVGKLENAIKQAVDSIPFKNAMGQLENEAKFRNSQTFTKIIHELYPQVGKMVEQAGLAYQPGK